MKPARLRGKGPRALMPGSRGLGILVVDATGNVPDAAMPATPGHLSFTGRRLEKALANLVRAAARNGSGK